MRVLHCISRRLYGAYCIVFFERVSRLVILRVLVLDAALGLAAWAGWHFGGTLLVCAVP